MSAANTKQGQDVEIAVVVKRATDRAILVNHGAPEEVWIPISQISDWCDGPDKAPGMGTTSIFIPEWLATEKGMV
jgi:hypothetical protein